MLAREGSRLLDLPEDAPDDRAQGVLHDLVVRDQAFRGLVAHVFVVAGKAVRSSCIAARFNGVSL
jgi:hypothetical protein